MHCHVLFCSCSRLSRNHLRCTMSCLVSRWVSLMGRRVSTTCSHGIHRGWVLHCPCSVVKTSPVDLSPEVCHHCSPSTWMVHWFASWPLEQRRSNCELPAPEMGSSFEGCPQKRLWLHSCRTQKLCSRSRQATLPDLVRSSAFSSR